MQALFIGQTYIDVTFLTDRMPTGDEKHVASAYAISFGGNAVTAAFCCAKVGIVPELLATVADDWLGRMFMDMAALCQLRSRYPSPMPSLSRRSASGSRPRNGTQLKPQSVFWTTTPHLVGAGKTVFSLSVFP